MSFPFYVTMGSNGVIITKTFEHGQLCTKYLQGTVWVKGFYSQSGAEQHALRHLIKISPLSCPIPRHLELGKLVTAHQLMSAAKLDK